MRVVEVLNAWGTEWAAFMLRSLIEATALLAAVVVLWLPLRRRMSSQFAYGLFLLVLVKAAVPIPVTLPAGLARLTPRHALERLAAWTRVGAPGSGPAPRMMATQPTPASEVTTMADHAPGAVEGPQDHLESVEMPLAVARRMPERAKSRPIPSPRWSEPPGSPLTARAMLGLAWAAVVLGLATRFAMVHVQMARRLRDASPLDPATLPIDLGHLHRLCGLRGEVPLVASSRVAAPAVWGLLRPRVLIPPGLVEALSPGQLTWVLLHELVHVRRRDAWVVLFQRLVQIAYFIHPAVWAANRLIDVQREYACDDAALALAGDVPRRDCGAGFLAIVERASTIACEATAAPGLFGSHTFLRRRLMRILDSRRTLHRRLSVPAATLLGIAAILVLPYARAQDRPPPPISREAGRVTTPASRTVEADPASVADAPSGQAIEFLVVGKDDGRPLAGVTVEARVFWGDYTATLHTTGDDGRCRIELTSEKMEWVIIGAVKEGHIPLTISFKPGDFERGKYLTYTMSLRRGTRIGGVVQDERGRPIAGATVVPWFMGKVGGEGKERFYSGAAGAPVTDAQGRWRADVLPPEAGPKDKLLVRLHHPDYASEREGFSRSLTIEHALAMTDVQVMKDGLPITGTVLDLQGRPVAGATVTLAYSPNAGDYERTRSDSEGRFRFGHVDASERRTLALNVEAAGFAPAVKRVLSAPDAPPPQEIRLTPGRPLGGRVVDGEGRPISGAVVKLDSLDRSRGWTWRAETDADGRFTRPDGPATGEFYLNVSRPPFTRAMDRRVTAGASDVAITLHRPLRLHGKVVDAETGAPIDAFTLIPGWGPDRPGGSVSWRRDGTARKLAGGRFDEVGLFPDQGLTRSLRVEAEGYLPSDFLGFKDDEGEIAHDFKMERGAALTGIIRRPDGRPAAGAMVVLSNSGAGFVFADGKFDNFFLGLAVKCETGADGRYSFRPQAEPSQLTVVHDAGFARRSPEQLAVAPDLTLEPWGRIEGVVRVGARPGAGQDVGAYVEQPSVAMGREQISRYKTKADAEGRFVIERVIPGDVTIHRVFPFVRGGSLWTHLAHVTVPPGETVRVTLGGTGRPVVGRVTAPGETVPSAQLVNAHSMIAVKIPLPSPPDFASYDAARRQEWFAAFRKSEQGQEYYRKQNRFGVEVAPDGTFRAEDVPQGHYQLTLSFRGAGDDGRAATVASATREIDVPEAGPGRGEEPFDIGAVELKMTDYRTLEVGQPAPALLSKTLDGKPLALADYHGKYVLLDFWATWCAPCLAETPHLKDVYDAFGKDDRFAMVGLSLDESTKAPEQYAAKNGLRWTQAFLGRGGTSTATADFGV